MQVPQVQISEEIVEVPVILSAQGAQASQSLGTTPSRRVSFCGDRGQGRGMVTSACRICSSGARDDARGRCASCCGGGGSICSCDPLRRSSARRGPRNVGYCG